VKAWSKALLENDAVIGSVPKDFSEVFDINLHTRNTLAAQILDARAVAE
jgi:hypothetical protein